MKDIFGRVLAHDVAPEHATEFARKLSLDNCRRTFVINLICMAFLSVLFTLDVVRFQKGLLFGNPKNELLAITHFLVALQIFPFWVIKKRFNDIKNGLYNYGNQLTWLTLASLALALLPMAVLTISTRSSVAIFAIYMGTVNIVALLPHRERFLLNGLSLLVMIVSILIIQRDDLEIMLVNIFESLAVVIPNLIFSTFQYNLTLKQFKNGKILEAQKTTINEEKQRSEALLYNILPVQVAHELKESGKVTPLFYTSATVLFTDFKGFSMICQQLSPQQLIDDLSYCFSNFDQITVKYQLERVKTIGDAYMCVGGVPAGITDHAERMVLAAIEIQDFLQEWKKNRIAAQLPYYEARIGIHSGPLVAGVAGTAKFAFDTWGETVNIAARMEASSEPNRINISGATHALVQHRFPCTFRGKIAAKNVGEIEMYFIN